MAKKKPAIVLTYCKKNEWYLLSDLIILSTKQWPTEKKVPIAGQDTHTYMYLSLPLCAYVGVLYGFYCS